MRRWGVLTIGILLVLTAAGVRAQDLGPAPNERPGAGGVPPARALPGLLEEVGLDQHLNAQLPLDLHFKDENGQTVKLGDFFGRRPVILTLVYYQCPMLCTQVLNGVTSSIGVMNLSVGKDFDIVTVSFDPRDTPEGAKEKKANYLARYKRPGAAAGWHFLTGEQREISALTGAVGFRYAYNAEIGQYAHVSGIMVATPEGRLARYFYGIEYGPRDLRLALVEAADHKIGSPVDQLLLYCFHYDPSAGRYSLAVMNIVRIAGVLTVLVIVGAIVLMRRRERRGALPRNVHA